MNENQIVYDVNKCFCKKNKFTNEQCSYKKKDNSNFCGIHTKSKLKDIYPIFIQLGLYQEINELNVQMENNIEINGKIDLSNEIVVNIETNIDLDELIFESKDLEKKKVYDCKKTFFEDLFIKNKELSVYTLRQSIKNLNLKNLCTKQSRPELLKELKDYYERENYYKKYLRQIILIQKFIRKWSSDRIKKCVNDTDILTFDNIQDISKDLLYIFKDFNTKLNYAFDIRTLVQIMNQDKPCCPYTCKEYTVEEKIKIMNEIENRKKKGIKLDIEKIKLKPEEETEMRMIDIFHKLNLLGNYTSHLWLKNMSINQLIKFYSDAEDLWVYRLGLSHKERKKYVKNGQAFLVPVYEVKTFSNLNRLRNVCLDEIERFISDGVGMEEKKLGGMWMLTVLVDCSFEAALALPHLVQV